MRVPFGVLPDVARPQNTCVGNRISGLRGFRVRCFALRSQLRQTKIENLRVASLGDEDIRRLDVAVNNAFRVSGI